MKHDMNLASRCSGYLKSPHRSEPAIQLTPPVWRASGVWRPIGFCITLMIGLSLLINAPLSAQPNDGELKRHTNDDEQQRSTPIAWVNEQPITLSEVEPVVQNLIKNRNMQESQMALIRATALEQIIGQRLVLNYLESEGLQASESDLAVARSRMSEQLERFQRRTLEQYLQDQELTMEQFDTRNAWRIGWQNYLDEFLTQQNVNDFFERHRKTFDGTQLHAWQIFVKVDADASDDQITRSQQRLRAAAEAIQRDEMTFSEAASQISEAPTRERGGDLGWVKRKGSLPESVAEKLFDMPVNQVSEPIRSAYGLHLVRWTEEKAGTLRLADVEDEVRQSATRFLFDWIVDRMRPEAQIRYSGKYPHFEQDGIVVFESESRGR